MRLTALFTLATLLLISSCDLTNYQTLVDFYDINDNQINSGEIMTLPDSSVTFQYRITRIDDGALLASFDHQLVASTEIDCNLDELVVDPRISFVTVDQNSNSALRQVTISTVGMQTSDFSDLLFCINERFSDGCSATCIKIVSTL